MKTINSGLVSVGLLIDNGEFSSALPYYSSMDNSKSRGKVVEWIKRSLGTRSTAEFRQGSNSRPWKSFFTQPELQSHGSNNHWTNTAPSSLTGMIFHIKKYEQFSTTLFCWSSDYHFLLIIEQGDKKLIYRTSSSKIHSINTPCTNLNNIYNLLGCPSK